LGSGRRGPKTLTSRGKPTAPQPGRLPRELTSFIGRQQQVEEVSRALRTVGVVTLAGTGGVGKTRLALRIAAANRAEYAYGASLVELAPVSDASQVATAIADALGIRERPGWNTLTVLGQVLRERQMLLVLDNCEHVLPACAAIVTSLLRTCDNLVILATSREPLGVPGEVVYSVPPLPIASADDSIEAVVNCDAVRLLVARIQAAQPSFELPASLAPLAERICRLVDGLPLGIELAASRTRTMSLAEIAERLSDPLSLLTAGPRAAPRRQQTLRATIDWSYALLTEPDCEVLRRLAVFTGGCTFDGIEAVCGDPQSGTSELREVLDRLVGHSLVIADTRQERTRFSLLETVRQYCLERLNEAGESDELRARHRDWCLRLVVGPPPEAFDTAHVDCLAPELDNLRAALRWTVETRQVEAAARLGLGMTAVWHLRGKFSEGRAALTAVFGLAGGCEVPPVEVVHAGTWASVMAVNQGDYRGGEELLLRVVDLARASGDRFALLFAENQLGWVAFVRGDTARARETYERTYAALGHSSEPIYLVSRYQLALACLELGDHQRAHELLDNFADLEGASRSGMWRGRLFHARALLAEQAGDYRQADRLFEQAITAERSVDDQPGLLRSLTQRGAVAAAHGDHRVAAAALAEALQVGQLHASKLHVAHLLEALANLMLETDLEACVRLAAAAGVLRTTMGAAPSASDKARLGRYLEVAKQRIGERAYAKLWVEAQTEPLDSTLALVQQLLASVNEAPLRALGLGAALSEREREVAVLVTRGYSNREIAEELVISLKTAEAHIHHVLNKLGLSNRVQIATWGLRHGVVAAAREKAS
jgi:predicted ATPase/DNA-binding CsgD family transcriptional regulator